MGANHHNAASCSRRSETPHSLTMAELENALKTALEGRYGFRDALLISFLYHHCMRTSEVLELKVSDVEHGRIRINRKKGGFPNEHWLRSAVGKPWLDEERLLCRYLVWRSAHFNARSDRLFLGQKGLLTRQQVYNIVRNAAIATGIHGSKSMPRMLKHSGIAHLIERGMPVLHARSYGGGKIAAQLCFLQGISGKQIERAASAAFARSNKSGQRRHIPKSVRKRRPQRIPPERRGYR
jgi:site-specific recombinase XerD